MRFTLGIFLILLTSYFLRAQPFEWGQTLGGSQNDVAQRLCLGSNGNSFTAGTFSTQLQIADTTINGFGFQDVFVSSHNELGELVWISAIGGSGTDQLSSMCVDNFGDIWIAGRFTGKIDVDPGPDSTIILSQPANSLDGFLVKLSGSDGSLLGFRNLTSGGIIDIRTMRTDPETDDIFIGGQYANTVDFDFGTGFQLRTSNVTSGDCFIGRYTGDFNFSWINTFGSTNASIDFVSALDFDSQGAVYCTGMLGSTTDIDPGPGTTNLSCFIDAFLIKYNRSNGQLIWGFNLGGSSLESGNAIAISDQDEIVISGTMNSSSFDADPSFGIVTINSGGIAAVPFIARYETNGQVNSAFALQGTAVLTASITSLQFTLDSYLVAGGFYTGTLNFTEAQGSPVSFTSGSTSDAFVAVFTVDNRLRDIINITGIGNQQVSDILVSGELTYVCGSLENETSPQLETSSTIVPLNAGTEGFVFRYNENPTKTEPINPLNAGLLVFPNPASQLVNLSVPADFADIIDVSGRVVKTFSGNNADIHNIPAGIYYVRIRAMRNNLVVPMVISH